MTDTALAPTTAPLVASAVDPEVSAAMVLYERIAPLQAALGLQDHTVPEMQLFAMVAHRLGLDPFARQIYSIKRAGKVTHQVGIDGFRSVAERTGQYAGSDEAAYEACDCGQQPEGHPRLARVVVHRILANGHVIDQVGIARWHEVYPGAGEVGAMYRKMPFNQLAKCAEANGLRKAFPRVLGGVYIPEEMQQADADASAQAEAQRVAALPSTTDRLAARRASIEATAPASIAPVAAAVAPSDGTGEAGEAPPSATGDSPATECGDEDASPMGLGFCGLAKGHGGTAHKSKAGTWPR